jgi:hypothetical protein
MLKVCFCAKQVDGLMASNKILTSKNYSIKPPICKVHVPQQHKKLTIKGRQTFTVFHSIMYVSEVSNLLND